MEFMDKVSEISKKVGEAAGKTFKVVKEKTGKMVEVVKTKIEEIKSKE